MTKNNPLDDLKEIRKMMESSSKFLSLSGLSGVFAGIVALIGAGLAYQEIRYFQVRSYGAYLSDTLDSHIANLELRLLIIAIAVLTVALTGGVFFTWLKARKQQQSIWTPLSLKLIISLMVPLLFGGLFTLGMLYQGGYAFVAPATLMFYGLALLQASKYVHVDIKYLALSEMVLALLSLFWLTKGLIFWAIGFGVLHILYGLIMYFKYDRKA